MSMLIGLPPATQLLLFHVTKIALTINPVWRYQTKLSMMVYEWQWKQFPVIEQVWKGQAMLARMRWERNHVPHNTIKIVKR